MTISVIADGLVAILLVATIVCCVVLNRRLSGLRRNEAELMALIARFNEATARAETGIETLRKTGAEVTAALRDETGRAGALRDELAFLVEKADALAARLDRSVASARAGERSPANGGGVREARPGGEGQARSRAERDLLKALQAAR